MASWRSGKAFDWRNLGVRLVSALVLAPAALAAAWFGGWAFLLLIGVGVALLSIEWALMSTPGRGPSRMAAVLTAVIVAAICTLYAGHEFAGWAVAFVGAGAAAASARLVGAKAGDAAFGVIYLAAPALALVWLRGGAEAEEAGRWWTLMVLAVAWAADGAAFVVGSLLGGPKLWPRLSPNKTWSGFVGGLVAGAAAGWGVAVAIGAPAPPLVGLGAGLLCAFATMAGDLFESMIKRRFGVKDSGDLIPGHGGLLDRVDGLMMAILAMAAVRLALEAGAFRWL